MVGGHEHKSRRIQGPMGTRVNQIGTSKLVLDHPGIASQARRSRDAYGGFRSSAVGHRDVALQSSKSTVHPRYYDASPDGSRAPLSWPPLALSCGSPGRRLTRQQEDADFHLIRCILCSSAPRRKASDLSPPDSLAAQPPPSFPAAVVRSPPSTAAVTCRAPRAVAGALEARDRLQRRRHGRRAAQHQQPRSHRRRQRGRRVAQRGQHRGHRHGGVRPSAQGFPGSPFGQVT